MPSAIGITLPGIVGDIAERDQHRCDQVDPVGAALLLAATQTERHLVGPGDLQQSLPLDYAVDDDDGGG